MQDHCTLYCSDIGMQLPDVGNLSILSNLSLSVNCAITRWHFRPVLGDLNGAINQAKLCPIRCIPISYMNFLIHIHVLKRFQLLIIQ